MRPWCAALAVLAATGAWVPGAPADDGEELVTLMSTLQTFTHKLQLSIEHDNGPLASFYLHEIEEALEKLAAIGTYDGYPVGELGPAILRPPAEALERALSSAGAAAAERELDALIAACNACHAATEHGFIVVRRNGVNPYPQLFEPTDR